METEQLRFGYESRLFDILETQLGSSLYKSNGQSQNLLETRKRDLLGNAVCVTADLLPEVHRQYQTCLDMLGASLKGDLFVQQGMEYNASVFAYQNRFDVLINSSLLTHFTPNEWRFVFGHELGHVIFGHSRFSVREILANMPDVSADTADMLFRWSRAAEVSADRIGLLCCGSLTDAVMALFRTASGLSGIDADRVLTSFRRQYESLEIQIREAGADGFAWVRTHPMMPIRFKAIELAALDIVALRQKCQGFSWKGFRAVDNQIARILESLDVMSFLKTG
jgi:Zn-dependent protease with chaperone function